MLIRYFITIFVIIVMFIITSFMFNIKLPSIRLRIKWLNIFMILIYAVNMMILILDKQYLLIIPLIIGIGLINFAIKYLSNTKNYILWYTIIFLLLISQIILMRLDFYLAFKQLFFIILGIFLRFILLYTKFIWLNSKNETLSIVILSILICSPFIFGVTKNGANNWVSINNISFQPSEFVKIIYIYLIALYFAKSDLIKPFILTAFVIGTLFIQRDLGSAFLYIGVFLIMIYVLTQNIRWVLIGLGCGSVLGIFSTFLFSHVKSRIIAWLNPWSDVDGMGYQLTQGMFAMGTWGVFGSGLNNGIPTKVPYVTTDYIFVAIVEELGLIVSIAVILSYLILGIVGINISIQQKEYFSKYLTLGCTSIIVIQSFVILAGILQIIPLTGITLPFVSYGGSSLISMFIMISILEIIDNDINEANSIEMFKEMLWKIKILKKFK
ncbi:hypothetical protein AN640_01535 [Candidatus Epulonipiscium fishelsonii]|uniref:Uncharacterized protein n=1 Tax=Candidatus Epulonipiscium fishelsonii TaxID=77094 RepID=A0ACC8XC93_9FIRM|nr:hypothetical protein AN640_01535 [Epulopiscium sp. SCG-D08WGA-EpuloA1]